MPQDQSLPALSLPDLFPAGPADGGGLPALDGGGLGGYGGGKAGGRGSAMATSPTSGRAIRALTGQQKAAILVQLLISEGADVNLASLPEDMQTKLTEQICEMRLVDRDTLSAVVSEFVETLEQVGLSFSGGIGQALRALDGKLSPGASQKLRRKAQESGAADPWERIASADLDTLLELIEPESAEVAAVVLSKLTVERAAELLGKMPGERARRVAYAVALTESIAPRMVGRIGNALAAQLDSRPPRAFPAPSTKRVGAILTSTPARIREELLSAFDIQDSVFAEGVRKAIFTFANIHHRLNGRDVPKVLRDISQAELITAFAAARAQPDSDEWKSVEFMLANMSQRMAGTLRDEIEIRGKVRPKDAEAAMNGVVEAIRGLVDLGEIELITDDED